MQSRLGRSYSLGSGNRAVQVGEIAQCRLGRSYSVGWGDHTV